MTSSDRVDGGNRPERHDRVTEARPRTPQPPPTTGPRTGSSGASGTQRALNTVMRTVLHSPLHRLVSGRIVELTIIGRKTGRKYTVPVGYARDGDALLIGTAGRWRRNLSRGTEIAILLRGRRLVAAAEVITDERRCRELYRTILARNPIHGRYANIRTTADGGPDPGDLAAALDRGIAVVRLTGLHRAEAGVG